MRLASRLMSVRALVAALVLGFAGTTAVLAAGEYKKPRTPEGGWSFSGPFGSYDNAALQRGFAVYKQVCSTCHGMDLLYYRNLGEPGGPGFSEEQVKALAAEFQVPAGPDSLGNTTDENGLPLTRPAEPKDTFRNPYPNEQAARAANGGALPPDLSVINKARKGGADYTYSLLTGYQEPPAGEEPPANGLHYNPYFPGKWIAMANPLVADGLVEYTDGTEATTRQMAKDVTHFLEWAGEPKMEQRKSLGLMVMGYLVLLAFLLYLAYKRVWRDVEH